eukprot:snap_masked-scaffold_32-processed-gene-3.14-mRNA-1 protein AED:0.04 eAED:0.04 QI:0/-1/0/1/-1/1/1/0/307
MDTKEVIAEVRTRLNGFFTPESLENGRNFKPRKDDIFVATAPKCGTTWTLQICHMLRSNGDTDFKDILLETPWDILAYDVDQNLNDEQKYSPRVFKSHETYENIAKGGKYIFVTRNPQDAFLSYYYFMLQSHIANPTTCSKAAFARTLFDNPGLFALPQEHIISYVEAIKKNPENVLFLFYEDMKEKPRELIENIARFMGLDNLPEEEFKARCDAAEKYSSLQYMKEFKDKFELREVMKRKFMKMPELLETMNSDGLKLVRSGKSGEGKTIPNEAKDLIARSWKEIVEKQIGYTSYEEFRQNFTVDL